jgi:hypothetical protein
LSLAAFTTSLNVAGFRLVVAVVVVPLMLQGWRLQRRLATANLISAKNKPDKDIQIIVITTADDLDESFKRNQPLRVVFQQAIKLVGGQGQPDQFALEYANEPLDVDRKIGDLAAELGWGDRVELELVPKPVVV